MKIGTNVRNSEAVHVLRKIVITMRNSNFVTKSVKHSKSKNEKVWRWIYEKTVCISMIRRLQLKSEYDERIIKFLLLIMKLEGKEKLKKSLVV